MGILALDIGGFVKFISVLVIFIFVLALTYFTTKWIASFQRTQMGKGNIEVIEARRISNNKMIDIVRIGKRYYAVAVSKDNISLISEVDEDEIEICQPATSTANDSFSQILNRMKDIKNTKRKDDNNEH